MFPERTIEHRGKTLAIGNSMDFLLRKKQSMGTELFACQYENNPIAGGLQSFTPAMLDKQTFHWLKAPDASFQGPVLPQQGVDFVVGDLAFVGSEKRDTTVFYICRLWNAQIWVYDCVYGQWGSEELTKQFWDTVVFKYRPQVVFIEQIPAWESYDYNLRSFAVQRNIQRYPVQWMQMSNIADAKKIRIGSIQAALANSRVWIYGHMAGYQELRTQLERFPKLGRHDDFADCLGLVVAAPSGWYTSAVATTSKVPEMLRKAREDDPTTPEVGKAGSIIVC